MFRPHPTHQTQLSATTPFHFSNPTKMNRRRCLSVIEDSSGVVEAEDLVRDAGRSAGLNFVEMPEEVEPRPSGAVVQLPVGQHAQQRRFAGVSVTENGQTEVDEMTVVWDFADEHFQRSLPAPSRCRRRSFRHAARRRRSSEFDAERTGSRERR